MASGRSILVAGVLSVGVGCVVHEERRPPPRRVVVVDEAPLPPPPPPPPEVIEVSPGPEYVFVRGGYYRDHDHWAWRHSAWRRP